MSGIEVASLVIGIVPVVLTILKSHSALKNRLRTFTRYTEAARVVQLRHKVAATNFSIDCQLLLKTVVSDGRELSQMMDDPEHTTWQSPHLEEKLREFLGRHFQVLEDVVVKIRDLLQETNTRFSDLDLGLLVGGDNPSTMTESRRRLWNAFDFSRKENAHLRWLDDLEKWNTRLSNLRAQLCKLQKRQSCLSASTKKSLPKRYNDIRTSSQKLHDALRESFSCTNLSHDGHQAKLSLDAQAEYGTAQLDMVITCRRKPSSNTLKGPTNLLLEPPIWLQIRSVTTPKPERHEDHKPSEPMGAVSASIQPLEIAATHKKPSASCSPSVALMSKTMKKVKRVRFDASADCTTSPPGPPSKVLTTETLQQPIAVNFALLDLKTTPSVCCHLSKACQSPDCRELGYLESTEAPRSFTFIFYDAARNTEANFTRNIRGKQSHSIQTEISRLQTLHQLTLAHKLASAVLQYHSTPWLSEDWDLGDIAYFCEDTPSKPGQVLKLEDDITQALQTLHLSTQFPQKKSTAYDGVADDHEQLRYLYGIRNLTLAKLGVALLEIRTKQELATVSSDPLLVSQRVVTARRILHQKSPLLSTLGNRFLKIVQQCIDCDFSSGENLDDESLRSAVYSDVVCVLEDMLFGWKKVMGII